MGLSIYYSGRFNRNASLPQMIEEVKDIAKVFGWKYTVLATEFPANSFDIASYSKDVFGIEITPLNCETLPLTFLSNGRMSSSLCLQFYGFSTHAADEQYLYSLSCKTQYGGSETHKAIIHLLRYVSKKYFSQFDLKDNSGYWETNDDQQLADAFRNYDILIDTFRDGLLYVPMNEGESLEEYFRRILSGIR